MGELQQIFQPHRFNANEPHVDLYHVYDSLSCTPYQQGIGIQCDDPDNYIMNAWHVITPSAMEKHLDWDNGTPTQFISFYDNLGDAVREQQRRRNQPYVRRRRNQPYVRGVDWHWRDPKSVRIAHVRLPRNTSVWVFSREEMLSMMGYFGSEARLQMFKTSKPSEWFVWGVVPDEFVRKLL